MGFFIVNVALVLSPENNCPAYQLVIGKELRGNSNLSNPIAVEFIFSIAGLSTFLIFVYDSSL